MSDNDIDALRAELSAATLALGHRKSVLASVIAERNALKQRVEELEANPPADRDRELRERLVCAALTGLCADPSVDLDEAASKSAVAIADRTLAAMRKGEQDGK